MIDRHLRTLEYNKALAQLARHADFSAGKELALNLDVTTYPSEVRARQAETTEARALLQMNPGVGVGGARDIRPLLEQAIRSDILTTPELLDVRQTLMSARVLKRVILRLETEMPNLAQTAHRLEPCGEIIDEIGRCIDDNGDVMDDASQELARVRRDMTIARDRLLERLEHIVHSPKYTQFMQDAIVTQRHGRYVVPLKAEFKGRIAGVVQDQSASGATLFVEPISVVELNNRFREAQMQEEQEVRRILLQLTEMVGDEVYYIERTVDALALLDLAFAKAKYAEDIDAVEPEIVPFDGTRAGEGHPGSTIHLVSARHPLLKPETVVPIDVTPGRDSYMLVITGPNTGGKTVSLKTVGLLAAMAQAGLHIPAAKGSKLSVFEGIYADIGDEQSIEQSLSTFSAHMTNIIGILGECDSRSLVILDELGAGTDPVEGSALARALLDYLRRRPVTAFVATHYSELKAYANAAPGVENASVEFDPETLSPTFKLVIGLPGQSNALAIAGRLGLDEEVVSSARSLMGTQELEAEALLAEIKSRAGQVRAEQQKMEQLRREEEKLKEELAARLEDIDGERRDILNSAREDARREIKAAREELREMRKSWRERAGQPPIRSEELKEIERRLDDLEEAAAPEEPPPPPPPITGRIEAGDRVWVRPLEAMADVIDIDYAKEEAGVQLGSFRTTAPLKDLELRAKAPERTDALRSTIRTPRVEPPSIELQLRGVRVEEALVRLDRYLDDAFLAGVRSVRIVHGKGTGAVRQAVQDALRENPLVESYRPGEEGEGGTGVTVAELATG